MRADTFKSWLRKKGCRFDAHNAHRGAGHSSLGIRLGDRRSTLPLVGTHQNIPATDVSRILHDLNLNAQELPGPLAKPGPNPVRRHTAFLARQAGVPRAPAARPGDGDAGR